MIKAAGVDSKGRLFVVLGLSRRNCELLLDGKPISVEPEALNLPPGSPRILLMANETEQDLARDLNQMVGKLD